MHTTEGIVLKKVPVGEADMVFTIFTKDYGKIKAVAQGVRKERAKLKGFLEPLNLVCLGLVMGRNNVRLTNASLYCFLPQARQSYEKLSALYYISELVDQSCMAGQKDQALWQILLKSFLWVEQAPDKTAALKNFLNIFEKNLLMVLGYDSDSDLGEAVGKEVVQPF